MPVWTGTAGAKKINLGYIGGITDNIGSLLLQYLYNFFFGEKVGIKSGRSELFYFIFIKLQ